MRARFLSRFTRALVQVTRAGRRLPLVLADTRLASAAVLLGWAGVTQLPAQQPIHRGARLSATASVQLFTAAGTVLVEGWDRDSIDIRGTVGRGLTPRAGGDSLAFKLSTYDGQQDLSQPSHLVVRVPRRAQLWLKGTTGTNTARALGGAVDLYSIAGPIEADGLTGDLTAESMRGDVTVRGTLRWLRARSGEGRVQFAGAARDVAASTVRGAIVLRGRSDRARVETVSGSVEVAWTAEGASSLDIDSHDGAVTLQLGPRRDAAVSLFTHDGRIDNQLTAARPSRSGLKGSALSLSLGTGDARVQVRTFSGTIVLGDAARE